MFHRMRSSSQDRCFMFFGPIARGAYQQQLHIKIHLPSSSTDRCIQTTQGPERQGLEVEQVLVPREFRKEGKRVRLLNCDIVCAQAEDEDADRMGNGSLSDSRCICCAASDAWDVWKDRMVVVSLVSLSPGSWRLRSAVWQESGLSIDRADGDDHGHGSCSRIGSTPSAEHESSGCSDAILLPSGIRSRWEQEKAFTHINNCLWRSRCAPCSGTKCFPCTREKFITSDSLQDLKCWSFTLMRKGKGS